MSDRMPNRMAEFMSDRLSISIYKFKYIYIYINVRQVVRIYVR